MAKRRLAVLLFAFALLTALPTATYAAVNPTGAGLVSCGVSSDPTVATECEACNVVQLVQNLIMFFIGLSIPVAMAMFAWAGILYFTSGAGGSENVSKAKKIFGNALKGFLLIITAWLIVNTILYTVLDKEQYPNSSWFHVDCSTGERVRTVTLGEVLANSLGVAPPVVEVPQITYVTDCGGNGFVYNPSRNICENPTTHEMKDPIKVTPQFASGSGVLCPPGNLACSPNAILHGAELLGATITQARANAMSCIAVTESSGDPNVPSPSGSSACGTWQILEKSNWSNPALHTGNCSVSTSCHSAECNLQSALLLGNASHARTGSYYSDWTCPNCNNKAAACVAKYDPGN